MPTPLLFIILALCWGSSFFWIKIALTALSPLVLVLGRVTLGAIGLCLTLFITESIKRKNQKKKSHLPSTASTATLSAKHHLHLMVMAVLAVAAPFLLLTQGESQISSSLTGLLNGTVPFFTILSGHFLLHDEPLKKKQFVGLMVGFLGLIVLFDPFHSEGSTLWGAFLVIVASGMYGTSAVYLRRFLPKGLALKKTAYMMTYSAFFLFLLWCFKTWRGEQGFAQTIQALVTTFQEQPLTFVSVVWLGLIGSCLAYLIYYHLIGVLGAGKASMVMYVCPLVAVLLGAFMLHENLSLSFYLGAALTLAGVYIASKAGRIPVMNKEISQK